MTDHNQNWKVRPLDPEADKFRLSELWEECFGAKVSPDEIARRIRDSSPDRPALRLSAEIDGLVVGSARATYFGSDPEVWHLVVGVGKAYRGRGIGSKLLQECEAFAVSKGAKSLSTNYDLSTEGGPYFAEKHGYKVFQESIGSQVEFATYEGQISDRDDGITFASYDQLDPEERYERFFSLVSDTEKDVPGSENYGVMDRATFKEWITESKNFMPELTWFAVDGDQLVAVSMLRTINANQLDLLETDYTGVRREYRGKRLAQQTKTRVLLKAKELGCGLCQTFNAASNEAMLAVNRKAGFTPYRTIREVTKKFGGE